MNKRKRQKQSPRTLQNTVNLICVFIFVATVGFFSLANQSVPTASTPTSSMASVVIDSQTLRQPQPQPKVEPPPVKIISSVAIPPPLLPCAVVATTVSSEADCARLVLLNHPLRQTNALGQTTLEAAMATIHQSASCQSKPIFMSMASVGSDIYWQMIENFIYTMVKFDLSDCALMICVSDLKCMQLCDHFQFPCFNFQYTAHHQMTNNRMPSALEQIALLKLYLIPKALAIGIDVFTVDLDVGFLDDPMILVNEWQGYPNTDVFVQDDIAFIMNRSVAGWRTWYTNKLPNIGLLLCRGNDKTVKMFSRAWQDYQTVKEEIRFLPGKDQNKVADALRFSRGHYGLRWRFFTQGRAVLVDKIYKFENKTVELGGEVRER
jgi:Nucleotide-diphospho-sugar transferase